MYSAECSRLNSAWRRLRADYTDDRYSLERMSALREYCDHTPLWRALLVFPLSIAPALTTIVVLDALRLQDPSAGWDANPTFWLRAYLGTAGLSLAVMSQLRTLVPAASMTSASCVAIGLWAGGVFTASVVLIAKLWVFPVPFAMVVCNPPWSLALFGATWCAIGKRMLAARPQIKQQLQRFSNYISFISTFLVIYPVYNMAFRSLSGTAQLAFLLLLPVIKLVLKRVLLEVLDKMEDSVFVIASAVDMFNALFQAKCMQGSGSTWTTAGVIVIDAVQNVYSLWCLMHSVGRLQGISWKPVPVSASVAAELEKIRLLQEDQRSKRRRVDCASAADGIIQPLAAAGPSAAGLASVVPWPQTPSIRATPAQAQPNTPTKRHQDVSPTQTRAAQVTDVVTFRLPPTVVVKNTLELLWRTERVLLVEFIESAIPLLYSVSLGTLYYLPNAQYYPGTVEMDEARLLSTVVSILIYSALEFLSLVFLHVVLKWKFNMSAVHQLAFVLTAERAILQGVFVSWTIVVLSFTLEHYGSDLTFEFKWVHTARNHDS